MATSSERSTKSRIIEFDILKVIGLLGIFFAHTTAPPQWLIWIRSFDVTLMIFVSARLFFRKDRGINTPKKYFLYILNRLKRLYLPTAFFLILFFLFTLPFGKFGPKIILDSFLLRGGIGYVWIIRIFIISAILEPLIELLQSKISTPPLRNIIYWAGLTALLVVYELLCVKGFWAKNFILNEIGSYIIPIILIGSVARAVTKKPKTAILFTILFSSIWILYVISGLISTGNIPLVQEYKYPFRIFYLSYGISISLLLEAIFRQKIAQKIYGKVVAFISQHSLWIYYWHIVPAYAIAFAKLQLPFIIEFVIFLLFGIIMTYIQNRFVKYLLDKKVRKNLLLEILSA